MENGSVLRLDRRFWRPHKEQKFLCEQDVEPELAAGAGLKFSMILAF
jgi:hypothetical protein